MKTINMLLFDNSIYTGATLFAFFLIGCLIWSICSKHRKSFTLQDLKASFILFLCCQVISIIFFTVSTIWVEYPVDGRKIYIKNQDGKWIGHGGRVWHTPFFFKGYVFGESGIRGIIQSDLNPLLELRTEYEISDVTFFLNNSDFPDADYMEENSGGKISKVINSKIGKIIYKTSKEEMLNDNLRLNIFQKELGVYGIKVTSVTF